MANVTAEKKTTLKLTLELTREEAEIMVGWTQNSHVAEESESIVENHLRYAIFHVLQAELK